MLIMFKQSNLNNINLIVKKYWNILHDDAILPVHSVYTQGKDTIT